MPIANQLDADIVLRPVRADDSGEILRWRNDELTRAMSLTSDVVDEAAHEAWFARLLADTSRLGFVGTLGEKPVGWVRFDPLKEQEGFLVSITIAPEMRAKGLGKTLLARGLEGLWEQRCRTEVYAQIKGANHSSRKIFVKNGFKHNSTDGLLETMVLAPFHS